MTQYIENTLKLINKENNFDKSNSKLVIEYYEDLIDFSAIYYNCYDKVKKLNLDKGFKAELDKELKKQSSEFYQVVKKCSANHLTAMRKLGKNPLTSKKVVKKKIEDCNAKKKPIKFGTIRGMGNLFNETPKEKSLEEVIQEFFKSTSKKFDCSNKKIIDTITQVFQAEVDTKKIEDQQTQQLKEQNEIAEDLIKMGLNNNPNEKLDKMLNCVNA
tara:strand:- start:174 stop:818 length:645 start_codon:yes stop_codon:yes gene_type:complete